MNTRARLQEESSEVLSTLRRIEAEVKKIDPLYSMFSQLQTGIDVNSKQIHDLKLENASLKNKVMAVEQRERINNVEISGLPTSHNENVKNICMIIAGKITCNLDEKDILACHRVPTRVPGKPPNIVVQLRDRALRADFIRSYKLFIKNNNHLFGELVHPSLGQQRIYINEHLCPDMKILRAETKKRALANGFKYIWVDEGQIKVRKDKEKPIVIKTFNDLTKMGRDNRDEDSQLASTSRDSTDN